MKRFLLAATLGTLALCSFDSRQARSQPADPPLAVARDAAGEVSIALKSLRWAPFEEVLKGEVWGDKRRRVLAAEFEVVGQAGDWKAEQRRVQFAAVKVRDDRGNEGMLLMGGGGDGRGRGAWDNLDPRAKTITLSWDVRLPKAPATAGARTQEPFSLRGVPLPDSWDGLGEKPFAVEGFSTTTKRGTRVVLESLQRIGGAEGRVALNFVLFPPAKVRDIKVAVIVAKASDSSGTDLMKAHSTSSAIAAPRAGRAAGRVVLQAGTAPGAKTIDIEASVLEDAPSLQDERWLRHIEHAASTASIPWSPDLNPPAPVAQAVGKKVAANIEAITNNGRRNYGVRLWLKPVAPGVGASASTAAGASTSLAPRSWHASRIVIRNGERSEVVENVAEQARGTQTGDLKWHAGGSPAREGESGIQYPLPVPESAPGAPPPTTADFVVTATQERRASHNFQIRGLKFPAEPGAMLAPRHIATHADGSRLIIWKVGRFDTERQPLLGPYSPRPGPIEWEGVVVVMEFRPAPSFRFGPAARFGFRPENAADDTGREVLGVNIQKGGRFSGHDGDVWKVLPPNSRPGAVVPGTKPKIGPLLEDAAQHKRTRQSWYSAFFDVPHAAARSLSFDVNVLSIEPGESETITLSNVPLPAAP